MPIVIHAIIPTDAALTVKAFYEKVFPEWTFTHQPPNEFWEITENAPTSANRCFLAMMTGHQAPNVPLNYYVVASIDEKLPLVTQNGGSIVVGKSTVPGVGYFAQCLDVADQNFGFWEEDTSAT